MAGKRPIDRGNAIHTRIARVLTVLFLLLNCPVTLRAQSDGTRADTPAVKSTPEHERRVKRIEQLINQLAAKNSRTRSIHDLARGLWRPSSPRLDSSSSRSNSF